uniref:Uncharacterized protein n=1 Tax=Anopheles epiroticus TaxID=199890 RepID=A0A182PQN7_9DIPT
MVNSFVPVVIILGLVVPFCHSTALNGGTTGGSSSSSSSSSKNNNINKASNVNLPVQRSAELEGGMLTGVLPDEPRNADSERFDALTLEDQVRLLSKQLNALTYQRREDYKMLENGLKKYVRKNAAEITDAQIREELDQLR